MRQFLMLMAYAFTVTLAAENIGNVEYHLPGEWKMVDNENIKTDDTVGVIRVYIPQGSDVDTTKESFGAEKVDFASGEVDQASIEKMYEIQFPNFKTKVDILEKTPESVLYEWSLKDDKNQERHGWTRIFTSPERTILLNYQTKETDRIKDLGAIWLKVLKDAKVVNSKI